MQNLYHSEEEEDEEDEEEEEEDEEESRELLATAADRVTAGPLFNVTFKAMISSYRRFKAALSVEGDERAQNAAHEIHRTPSAHGTYFGYLRRTHLGCDAFLRAARAAAAAVEEPPTPDGPNVDPRELADGEFDVWLTVTLDRDLRCETKVETGDGCSPNLKRVLSEGPLDYEMNDVWEPMKNLLGYVFCSTLGAYASEP